MPRERVNVLRESVFVIVKDHEKSTVNLKKEEK